MRGRDARHPPRASAAAWRDAFPLRFALSWRKRSRRIRPTGTGARAILVVELRSVLRAQSSGSVACQQRFHTAHGWRWSIAAAAVSVAAVVFCFCGVRSRSWRNPLEGAAFTTPDGLRRRRSRRRPFSRRELCGLSFGPAMRPTGISALADLERPVPESDERKDRNPVQHPGSRVGVQFLMGRTWPL